MIGNPPYVEYSTVRETYTVKNYKTESCGNLYAYFMERGLTLAKKFGMIVPISLVSTIRTKELRCFLEARCFSMHISSYADRPGTLFNGVHQKLCIILAFDRKEKCIFTTNFLHWYTRSERANLFDKITYNNSRPREDGTYPKIGKHIEQSISKKINGKNQNILTLMSNGIVSEDNLACLNMRLMFWVKCFLIHQNSNEYKKFYPSSKLSNKEIMAILNSSTFFWFWEVISDCWHLTNKELSGFCFDEDELSFDAKEILSSLSKELEEDLEKNKSFIGTVQTDYEYYHKKSKHIIDKIDTILAKHYNFTEEELDYIINYDIKYRMGLGNG